LRKQIINREVGLKDQERPTIKGLLERLQGRFELDGKATKQNLNLIEHVKADFGSKLADELTASDCDRYARRRKKQGRANATINRVFQLLRSAFRLGKVPWPDAALLDESTNAREGFFTPEETQNLLAELPDDGLRDYVRFAWITGMRKGELSALRWSYLHGDAIIIPVGVCKNRKPHRIPVSTQLAEILKRREAARSFESSKDVTQLSEYIFHRGDGLPVGDFKKSWRTATKAAGLSGRIFHDLRRTAVSDMIDAGVPQSTAMAISGHRTISVFLRYAISSDDAKTEALEKTAAYRAG
jgi:integrase